MLDFNSHLSGDPHALIKKVQGAQRRVWENRSGQRSPQSSAEPAMEGPAQLHQCGLLERLVGRLFKLQRYRPSYSHVDHANINEPMDGWNAWMSGMGGIQVGWFRWIKAIEGMKEKENRIKKGCIFF